MRRLHYERNRYNIMICYYVTFEDLNETYALCHWKYVLSLLYYVITTIIRQVYNNHDCAVEYKWNNNFVLYT